MSSRDLPDGKDAPPERPDGQPNSQIEDRADGAVRDQDENPDPGQGQDAIEDNADATGEAQASTAFDVIRPKMSALERRRRRRMLLQSMFITFFLTFSWIGGMIAVQVMSSTAYNFNAETRQVLERIRDGQEALVYEEASPLLQETMILDRFKERASDIRAAFGGFREILAIKRVESISGPGGETARVKATIEFDRARTNATFSYHYIGGTWRLLGLYVDLPDEIGWKAAARDETKVARKDAPAEIYTLSEQILELVADGKSDAVWDNSSEIFKLSVSRETFLEIQRQRQRILGKYQRIIDTMSATRSKNSNWASRSMLVQYQNFKTSVSISFRQHGGVWQMSYYKVEIPLPKVPNRVPERPPE